MIRKISRNAKEEQQTKLQQAVEEFRNLASQVPSDQRLTVDQFMERTERFRDLINVLGEIVLDEWRHAIKTVEDQAEAWAAEAGWRSRRIKKEISESLIGTYTAPQLLIYAEPNLYVLDPLARFIPGGQGSFDLAIQPSYHTTSLFRDDNGTWFVHLDVCHGVAHGKRVEWGKDAFYECFHELRAFV